MIIRPVDPYVYKLLLDTCEQGLVWVVAVIIRPVDPYVYKLLLDTCEQGLVWVVAVIIRPVDLCKPLLMTYGYTGDSCGLVCSNIIPTSYEGKPARGTHMTVCYTQPSHQSPTTRQI